MEDGDYILGMTDGAIGVLSDQTNSPETFLKNIEQVIFTKWKHESSLEEKLQVLDDWIKSRAQEINLKESEQDDVAYFLFRSNT